MPSIFSQKKNIAAIGIQAAPISSKEYWTKMGAVIYTEDEAFIEIPKRLETPTDGKVVDVKISLFKEAMLYEATPGASGSGLVSCIDSPKGMRKASPDPYGVTLMAQSES